MEIINSSNYTKLKPECNSTKAYSKFDDIHYNGHSSYILFAAENNQSINEQDNRQANIINNIFTIMSKEEENRNSSETTLLSKYLITRQIFKDLTIKMSQDVVKQMIRLGSLKLNNEGDILALEGKRLKMVQILLYGEVGIARQRIQDQQKYKQDIWQTLDLLIQKIGRLTKFFRLQHFSSDKKNLNYCNMQKSPFENKSVILGDLCSKTMQIMRPQCFLEYHQLLNNEPRHQHILIANTSTIIFQISLQNFYECIFQAYTFKMNQKIRFFRQINIFNVFQNSKLKYLIQKLKITELQKNQYVYNQGDKPALFYMLIQGEIQISKTIDILAQNPNNFYKNRAAISKKGANSEIQILSYANFQGVYNYQPQQKLVILARITPVCIFGQEELIQKTLRRVNAKVVSPKAVMYQISLDDIEEVCAKMVGSNGEKKMTLIDFLMMIEENITLKKILLRQNQLSGMVNHQNKKKYKKIFQNMNSKKYKSLSKNKQIRENNSCNHNFSKEEEVTPTYDVFNYTDFEENKDPAFTLPQNLSPQQAKVMQLTHMKVSKPILKSKEKIMRVRHYSKDLNLSSKIMNYKSINTIDQINTEQKQRATKLHRQLSLNNANKITLQNPLFNLTYFKEQQTQEKRLHKEIKKQRLSFIYKNLTDSISH